MHEVLLSSDSFLIQSWGKLCKLVLDITAYGNKFISWSAVLNYHWCFHWRGKPTVLTHLKSLGVPISTPVKSQLVNLQMTTG